MGTVHPLRGAVEWPAGPPTEQVSELVRTLELTITRRLDGALHGNHQGITPGHGSEPGEARLYQPGDDPRRIDWNVTARTQETHVRDQIADRDLEAWVVVDMSAAMRFGTTVADKAQAGLVATAAVGFLTARNQNRLGAVLVSGPELKVMPPRFGRDQVRAVLANAASAPSSEGLGRSNLAGAIDRVAVVSKRRGFVAVVSDFSGEGGSTRWPPRHAPRPAGHRGARSSRARRPADRAGRARRSVDRRRREVRVTAAVQRSFAEAAAEEVERAARRAPRRRRSHRAGHRRRLARRDRQPRHPPYPGRQRAGPASLIDTSTTHRGSPR